MELQFPKETYDCMHCVLWDVTEEEQTQEIKLGEALPDIGRVLSAWGQTMVRSKEWRGNGMSISGGVMAWVLFLPEDGSAPRCVETWIPFQMRWEFPQTRRDGAMRVTCHLKNIDARTVSARKLMVRAVVSAAAEALEPGQFEVFQPLQLPEDVQVQRKRYPLCIPVEAGEKTFLIDEEFPLPSQLNQGGKLACCMVQPEVTDVKVMTDKLVFRGSAVAHCVFTDGEGQLRSSDFEVPFSQYADLEREYSPEASGDLMLTLTNLEPEVTEEGMLRLKAGFVGQYVIYNRPVLEVVEDAYSTCRQTELHKETVTVPVLLDAWEEKLTAQGSTELSGQPVEMNFTLGHPLVYRQGDTAQLEIPGYFHSIDATEEGALSGDSASWEGRLAVPMAANGKLQAVCNPTGRPRSVDESMENDVLVQLRAVADSEISMVTGFDLGEAAAADPERPSLLLRRKGSDSLWDIAKSCGATVADIQKVNGLEGEPEENRFLLIPLR